MYDFPLFTVMDQVQIYKPDMLYDIPGLYYIETKLYFPTRGNGWYSHCMTDFLIKKGLISKDNIKYVVCSSLSVPQDYFDEFIDYIYNIKDGYEKL